MKKGSMLCPTGGIVVEWRESLPSYPSAIVLHGIMLLLVISLYYRYMIPGTRYQVWYIKQDKTAV